jgi:predicted PurR-regulated permease PerM
MSEPDEARKPDPRCQVAWQDVRLWDIAAVRDVFWIALIVAVVWLGYQLSSIFTPVLIALALAYLFHPVITWCETRCHMPRWVTISLILVAGGVVLIGGLSWLGPMLVGELASLARAIPRYVDTVEERATVQDGLLRDLGEKLDTWSREVAADPAGYLRERAEAILAGGGTAAAMVGRLIGGTTYLLMTAALIPIYFFFFAWQFGPLVHHFQRYIPVSQRDRWLFIISQMDRAVSTYFRDRVVIAGLMAVMFAVGWLFCGVPYALLLGIAAGALSLIPYAASIVWPLAVGLTWLHGGSDEPWTVWFLWPSVIYWVVQSIESWFLTPWIQGKSMEMSVPTILIVIFIGGAVGGLYGLLLCIPLAACGKILLREVFLPRLEAWANTH